MEALRRNALTIWPGMTIYWIGDLAHQGEVSGHNPDDYPGVRAELLDADSDPEVRAQDFMIGPVFTTEQGWRLVNALVKGVDKNRLYYVIYRSTIWRRATGFKAEAYGGSNNHNDHVHVSGYVTDDANGSSWQSVLALSDQEDDMGDVYYRIQSTDTKWGGRLVVSNRIHRRLLRAPGSIALPARAGATEFVLTDALRGTMTWEQYLDAVAGPEFPKLVCNCNGGTGDHTHPVAGTTGPAEPSP